MIVNALSNPHRLGAELKTLMVYPVPYCLLSRIAYFRSSLDPSAELFARSAPGREPAIKAISRSD